MRSLRESPRVVVRTPATGENVYLKREDQQAVLMKLSDEEIATGVVYLSAGDQAQGFAMACRSMGIQGRGYVQATTLTGDPCAVVEVLHDRR